MHRQFTPEFIKKFWQRVDKNGPVPAHAPELGACWLWVGNLSPRGYGQCYLKGVKDIPGVGHRAHRISFYIAFGWILPGGRGYDIAHKCDTRHCVNPRHLMCISHATNIADRNEKGRQDHGPNAPRFTPLPKKGLARGERAARSKLTADQVRAIRSEYQPGKRGFGVTSLARKYGVHDYAIEMIVKRKSWTHID